MIVILLTCIIFIIDEVEPEGRDQEVPQPKTIKLTIEKLSNQ